MTDEEYNTLLQPIMWEIRCLRENVMLASRPTAELVLAIEMLQHENAQLQEQIAKLIADRQTNWRRREAETRRKNQLARLARLEKTLQSIDSSPESPPDGR